MHGADVNTMERGMLFVVIAVVPIISTTSPLSPLNSPRPGSSTRLLISMDVTPRRPIHRAAASRRQSSPGLFLHLHQPRALFIFHGRSVLEILFHLASPRKTLFQEHPRPPLSRSHLGACSGTRDILSSSSSRRSSKYIATLINHAVRSALSINFCAHNLLKEMQAHCGKSIRRNSSLSLSLAS